MREEVRDEGQKLRRRRRGRGEQRCRRKVEEDPSRKGGGEREKGLERRGASLSRRGEVDASSIASYVFARPAEISRASDGPATNAKGGPVTPVKIRFTRLTWANTRVLRGTVFGGAAKRCGKMRVKRWRRFLRTLRGTQTREGRRRMRVR